MMAVQSTQGSREVTTAASFSSRIGIIGAGATGKALMRAFAAAGLPVTTFWSRRPVTDYANGVRLAATAQAAADNADILFITVPDSAIAATSASVRWHDRHIVAHCSGALSLDVLAPAREQGATVAAWHPLYTFPRDKQTVLPTGVHFAYTGPEAARDYFRMLTEHLGGRLIDVSDEAKPTYHAAAVIACNYAVTLASVAKALFESIGIGGEEALEALLPLIRATVENLECVGLPGALTGPVVRGDLATLTLHRRALASTAFASLYDVLAQATATVALLRKDLPATTRILIEHIERGDMT